MQGVNKITAKNYSELELRKARKMGFKRKKPTKPKRSATILQKEKFLIRYNDFVDDVKMWSSEYDRDNRIQGMIDGIGKKTYSAPKRRKKRTGKKRVGKKRVSKPKRR